MIAASIGFAGFFAAMALVNTIYGSLARSAVSVVYAALMLVMVAIEAYNIAAVSYGAPMLHALLLSCYFAGVVAFAFTLLRSFRYDRLAANVTIAVLAINVGLVFAEGSVSFWPGRFYAVDQMALDALVVMLVVLGVRAASREGVVAYVYLAGLFGPAAGLVLNDFLTNQVFAHSAWTSASFDCGVAWEAAFFAGAVALRNRGTQIAREHFERLAYVDSLTGVANRRTFDETLARMWNVARRAGMSFAVLMIDIDHFKRLNDTRGHQVGDECLRRVAALCSSTLRRASDCFARYGGEEFAAILVNADLDQAVAVAENMRRAVQRDGGITISVGIAARVPNSNDRPETLLGDADYALYRAKHDGRNLVRATAFSTTDVPDSAPPTDRHSERR